MRLIHRGVLVSPTDALSEGWSAMGFVDTTENGISRLLSGVGSIVGGRGWVCGTLTPSEVVSDCNVTRSRLSHPYGVFPCWVDLPVHYLLLAGGIK